MRRSVSTSARSALLPPLARRMCAKRNARKTKIPQSSNMAGDCKDFQRCTLDNNGCLKLSSILLAFNAAVSEEQAWAVCFQTAKCMVNEWNSDSSSCYRLSDTSHILIHKDGFIHRSTVKLCSKGKISVDFKKKNWFNFFFFLCVFCLRYREYRPLVERRSRPAFSYGPTGSTAPGIHPARPGPTNYSSIGERRAGWPLFTMSSGILGGDIMKCFDRCVFQSICV